ncbi:MAG: thiolase [Alphaproteobacteria bacterium]|nr:thiolase [Alphaproteobacteria bacterium]
MMWSLRGRMAIVGVAEAGLGVAPKGWTPMDVTAEASLRALADAGLSVRDVDGVFSASAYYQMASVELAEYLGIKPRYTDSTQIGGSSFMTHVEHAVGAISAGLMDVALIAYGSTQRTDSGRLVTQAKPFAYEEPFRPRHPVSMYSLVASRHMHQYGTTREQLAEVAVQARAWARLNAAAFERGPLSIQDVITSRMISEPLTSRDCCLVTDGAGAVIITSAERARDLKQPPVYLLGTGTAHWHRHISQMPDLTVTAAVESGQRAYARAGLGPADIDTVQLYDAFTINTIVFLEDLGFCRKGEGGPFSANGAIAPGGRLPVNTNGGGLSYCHPGMYSIFVLIEAVRQTRGECGERQIKDVEVSLAQGNGGVFSSQITLILGNGATV